MQRLLLAVVVLTAVSTPAAQGDIDPARRYAYAENAGFIDWRPESGGAVVTDAALMGFLWSDSIGWIRLDPPGGGVTHDGNGNLSGWAYAENAGWIAFATPYSQVTINPTTGDFDGYAWSDSIGWIALRGSQFGVRTTWRRQEPTATPTQTPTVTPTPPLTFVWGDLDRSGQPGTVDAALILQWDAFLIDRFPGYPGIVWPDFPAAADTSADRTLGAVDAAYILQYDAFLIACFPADSNCDGRGPD